MSNPSSPRDVALAAAAALDAAPTGLVAYNAHGRVAVVGTPEVVDGFARGLDAALQCTPVRLTERAPRARLRLEGHLGAYRLLLSNPSGEPTLLAEADTVVDLPGDGETPLLNMSLRPFGYLAGGADPADWPALRAQAAELVGQFQKPRFFAYDPDICAHGRSGLEACRGCIDACPAEAITALAERVSVDPYLCQGGGVCATVCPTGAMRYSYPDPATTLERLRAMIASYRSQTGQAPVLLIGDRATLDAQADALPEHWLPFVQEELASVGLEVWLAAIAYGARAVLLARPQAMDAGVDAALASQLAIANALLAGMGYPEAVQYRDGDALPALAAMPAIAPAGYAGLADKRQALFMALDHLYAHAPAPQLQTPLPADAPLGRIRVDGDKCTLCMACGSVCPAKALSAGGDTPRLDFHEANCVQCGLCRQACPESAISLEPRLLHDPEQRRARRVLYEEPPFCCVSCGKPFATAKVIDRMMDKLAGHWMYQDETARARLKMCQDCRVIDMMKDSA